MEPTYRKLSCRETLLIENESGKLFQCKLLMLVSPFPQDSSLQSCPNVKAVQGQDSGTRPVIERFSEENSMTSL